ncbi:hypothetical protein F4810DRAFT_714963 [Camillea tinctor]|nr:hypothetical protein F4810DRAFT_714963 [Camillea tinctor]
MVPNYQSDSASLPILELRRLRTDVATENGWPPVPGITYLHSVRWMHDTVSIVKLNEDSQQKLGSKDDIVLFKSGFETTITFSKSYIFSFHGNPASRYDASSSDTIDRKIGIRWENWCSRQRARNLDIKTKMHWNETGGYGRLLCDFEQRGNWHGGLPPKDAFCNMLKTSELQEKEKEFEENYSINLLNKCTSGHVSSTAYTFAEAPIQPKTCACFTLPLEP